MVVGMATSPGQEESTAHRSRPPYYRASSALANGWLTGVRCSILRVYHSRLTRLVVLVLLTMVQMSLLWLLWQLIQLCLELFEAWNLLARYSLGL